MFKINWLTIIFQKIKEISENTRKLFYKEYFKLLDLWGNNKIIVIIFIAVLFALLFSIFFSILDKLYEKTSIENEIISDNSKIHEDLSEKKKDDTDLEEIINEYEKTDTSKFSHEEKVKYILSNTVKNRINFINKMILDLNINKYSHDIYCKTSKNLYKKISPRTLLYMDTNQLNQVKSDILQYGIYKKNSNGDYIKSEKTIKNKTDEPKKPIEIKEQETFKE